MLTKRTEDDLIELFVKVSFVREDLLHQLLEAIVCMMEQLSTREKHFLLLCSTSLELLAKEIFQSKQEDCLQFF